MKHGSTRKIAIIGAVVLVAAAIGGGAYAASRGSQPAGRQAFLSDVAHRLHVSPAQLKTALREAFDDELNAAVADHRLTQAQANAIRQRVRAWGFGAHPWFGGAPPLFGRAVGPPAGLRSRAFAPHRAFERLARYLGLSDRGLFSRLHSGQTLAQIAKAQGKTPAQLEQAIIAYARRRLDRLVAAKLLPSAREQALLAHVKARVEQFMNAPLSVPPWRVP